MSVKHLQCAENPAHLLPTVSRECNPRLPATGENNPPFAHKKWALSHTQQTWQVMPPNKGGRVCKWLTTDRGRPLEELFAHGPSRRRGTSDTPEIGPAASDLNWAGKPTCRTHNCIPDTLDLSALLARPPIVIALVLFAGFAGFDCADLSETARPPTGQTRITPRRRRSRSCGPNGTSHRHAHVRAPETTQPVRKTENEKSQGPR